MAKITYTSGDENKALTLPPSASRSVCPICRGLLAGKVDVCLNCEENAQQLAGVLEPVIAISLYSKPSRLRDWLTFYKSGPDAPADANAEMAVVSIFSRFFRSNQDWLAQLKIDGAIVVPSTHREPPHPLSTLLQTSSEIPFSMLNGLNRSGEDLQHNHPNSNAFTVTRELLNKRVLLIDDVYTSGARAQSAAAALRSAGVTVAALCILGRRYNPDYSEDSRLVLEEQALRDFVWSIPDRDVTQTSSA